MYRVLSLEITPFFFKKKKLFNTQLNEQSLVTKLAGFSLFFFLDNRT